MIWLSVRMFLFRPLCTSSHPSSDSATQALSILWLPPPESPPFKLICGESVRLGQMSTTKCTSHNTHTLLARTESHVPHLPMGRLEKHVVRNSGGRGKCGYRWIFPVSTTLTMWRFKKLWKTWAKENIMKKPFLYLQKNFVEKLKKFFKQIVF